MKNRLIMLGPPGAGKGTQAEKICKKFDLPSPLSTGDILREAVRKNTPLGLEAKKYMEKGELVPDDVVIGIVREKLSENIYQKGFLLDGFPRTVAQAEALDKIVREKDWEDSLIVVLLKVDEEKVVERITGRRVCEKCGANYHIKFNPPEEEGICDQCGGNLYQRKDDSEETVRNRLRVYNDSTAPLVEYYKKRGVLEEVEGTGDIEEVFERISRTIAEG